MINELLLNFAEWLGNQPGSQSLIGSFYMWNWIESTHVLTLMVFLGMPKSVKARPVAQIRQARFSALPIRPAPRAASSASNPDAKADKGHG